MAAHKVANISELNEGECKTYTVEGQSIAVFNVVVNLLPLTIPVHTAEGLWEVEPWRGILSPVHCTVGNMM